MDNAPCQVCGSTDLNLIDGYYYCVECGTQDANIRETLVDHSTVAPEGVILLSSTRKIPVKKKQKVDMSSEWHKWHTYNFILAGLSDELIALGAKPSFKRNVFWIWTRYIKRYQNKEELGLKSDDDDDEEQLETNNLTQDEKQKRKMAKQLDDGVYHAYQINRMTKSIVIAILYLALNYDKSHILLSDLYRFCREGRISILNCEKFLPSDLNITTATHWAIYRRSTIAATKDLIRYIAMKMIRKLKLGPVFVPNVHRILNNYITELCLPSDFKRLVLSLMHILRCDFLDMDYRSQFFYVRIPDYETVIMSYIVIGLKMCFGLDSDYEFKLSDVVDRINNEECHMKSYKTGLFSNPTDRLFSYREWRDYLQLRKKILCKSYLPIAEQRNAPVDDSVFIEQLDRSRDQRKPSLPDEITMNLINKIPIYPLWSVLPKSTYPLTFTPLHTYTEVVIEHCQDPKLKMMLSEDFTQYSLKYACQDMKLFDGDENIVKGVSHERKVVSAKPVVGTLTHLRKRVEGYELVYVRNCDNKNWFKTKRPTLDHLTIVDENSSDRISDHGYDSNAENMNPDGERPQADKAVANKGEADKAKTNNVDASQIEQEGDEEDRELETIEIEEEGKNIFDDEFEDLDEKKEVDIKDTNIEESNTVTMFEFNSSRSNRSNSNNQDSNRHNDVDDSKTDITFNTNLESEEQAVFDPETFDKNKIIRTLILAACKKYRIPTPEEYREIAAPKRIRTKKKIVSDESGPSEPKKLKRDITRPGEARREIDDLLAAYYTNLENDVIHQVSEQIRSVVRDTAEQERNTESVSESRSNINIVFEEDLNDTANQDQIDGQSQINMDESQVDNSVLDTTAAPNLNLEFETNSAEDDSDYEDMTDFLPKIDPNFDEETHDVKQLYVKFKKVEESSTEDDIYDLTNDPEITEILDKKLAETEYIPIEKETVKEVKSDSDDDLPLYVFKEDKLYYEAKRKQREAKYKYLIKNSDHIESFNYWMRHYDKETMFYRNRTAKFDAEVKENLPINFNFIIHECCAVVECSVYTLYKSVQNLETFLMSRFRHTSKL